MVPPTSHDTEAPPREAALFMQRIEQRAKSAGKAAGLCTVGLLLLIQMTAGLDNCGAWSMLAVGVIATFGILGRRAVRDSAADFQHTFRRPGMDAERREAVLAYLWKRAHPVSGSPGASKAAKDLLNELGIKVEPKAFLRQAHEALVSLERPNSGPGGAVEPAPAPPRQSLPLPGVPPPIERPGHASHRTSTPPAPPHGEPARPATTPSHTRPYATPHATPEKSRTPSLPPTVNKPAPTRASTPFGTPSQPAPDAARASSEGGTTSAARVTSALPPVAPPGSSAAGVGAPPEATVTCDYCGRMRTVTRGEAASLCPVCFPQIRLET